MENTFCFMPISTAPHISTPSFNPEALYRRLRRANENKEVRQLHSDELPKLMEFHKITPESMSEIWPILRTERGRTTDFSYAGILMWVEYFKYEYAIVANTLFIKGVVENDVTSPAFSLPVGELPLAESVEMIKDYCRRNGMRVEFSAVPEYAMDEMRSLNPVKVEELTEWADYLYEAPMLSTLTGKKMAKKRNHVNKFLASYPDWELVEMTSANAAEAMAFMDIFDLEGDDTPMAIEERKLTRRLIEYVAGGDSKLIGALLKVGGEVCAFTIGDVKGDTLFVHVEKATRAVDGSYEMINKAFAASVCERYPLVRFINREDDSGDEGLRKAKESYHPVELLKKYNVIF